MSHNAHDGHHRNRPQRYAKIKTKLLLKCRAKDVPIVSQSWVLRAKHSADCHRLGEGTYGETFLVRDPDIPTKRLVLKQFHRNPQELLRELEVLLQVRDVPGVQLLVGVCLGTKEIISEYAGCTLLEEILLGELASVGDMLQVTHQVLTIVHNLHRKGICHNDLKEDNICIRRTSAGLYEVTLIDFGLARTTNSVVFSRTLHEHAECYHWISPEVASRGRCSPASDVFSLGDLLFVVFGRFKIPYKLRKWATLALSSQTEDRPSILEGLDIIEDLLLPHGVKRCHAENGYDDEENL